MKTIKQVAQEMRQEFIDVFDQSPIDPPDEYQRAALVKEFGFYPSKVDNVQFNKLSESETSDFVSDKVWPYFVKMYLSE